MFKSFVLSKCKLVATGTAITGFCVVVLASCSSSTTPSGNIPGTGSGVIGGDSGTISGLLTLSGADVTAGNIPANPDAGFAATSLAVSNNSPHILLVVDSNSTINGVGEVAITPAFGDANNYFELEVIDNTALVSGSGMFVTMTITIAGTSYEYACMRPASSPFEDCGNGTINLEVAQRRVTFNNAFLGLVSGGTGAVTATGVLTW